MCAEDSARFVNYQTPDVLLTTYHAEGDHLIKDTHTVYIPAQFEDAPLDYYLMAKLDIGRDDANGEIAETEEGNNSMLFEGGVFLGADSTTNVVGAYVFYDNSAFDGYNAGPNHEVDEQGTVINSDDQAMATNKFALLPGQSPTFRNVTSYDKGINGVIIDVSHLPARVYDGRDTRPYAVAA
ncbi:MAG: hypothetical protein A2V70_13490 [Planctomycetes bacterium RBG_13_63_9]|nr:MAG: hypothetical protein A2V70_13490 [Planctomycetes bacterium RBG_13_63_9]